MQKISTSKHNQASFRAPARRHVVLGLTVMASLISQAYAQTVVQEAVQQAVPTSAQQVAPAPAVQAVEVKGFRGSLETSARDKRAAVGFQDSVFAEDLGKFPDTNIAESLNRIPGVQVSREITGEGLNIQIRGLGTSFTKILLNGAPIAVASTGRTDNQNANREVDLDLLPTDLFSKLTVSKSPSASMIEGGAAGVVDMRSARPFDNKGEYVAYNLNGMQNSVAKKVGNRGSVLGSKTFGDKFGILGGFAWQEARIKTTGFETIGWTNANLSATQRAIADTPTDKRNGTGGGNWTIPARVPANAGNGLTTGDVIDQAYLLAKNPGLTIQQIDNAIIPRLGRDMFESGDKKKYTGIVSAEYRPTESLKFYVDTMYSEKKNTLDRADMNWIGRNGAMIPLKMTVDRTDCTTGCVVTGGTFANAQHFLEYRPYLEDVTLWGVNPGMEWKLSDKLTIDAQLNMTRSKFHRESPTVGPVTPASSGNTVTYLNDGGVPQITSNVNLNDPNSFTWTGGRLNLQEEFRNTETKGFHSNLTWGDKAFSVKAGVAYDEISRRIRARDNSGAWQAAVCGNNPSVFLLGPNGGPACNGLSTPGASAAALYPGFGAANGSTAGRTDALIYNGSLVPQSQLANYLMPTEEGFAAVDWAQFSKVSQYDRFQASAPDVGSANTSASAGYIKEKTTGFYTEINGELAPGGYTLRYNVGVRYVKTDQTVGGFLSQADPRNAVTGAAALANGAKFPNRDSVIYLDTSYNNVLPSGSLALNLTRDLIARASVSRTMTRADPSALRPGINFSSPSADNGSLGNSTLTPFISDNVDLGLEWYTGREGYISATYFQKEINGFTLTENISMPFSNLAQYGVTAASLTQTQLDALATRGGPGAATVVMARPRNAAGLLKITGLEIGWVQPLDKFLPIRGFGFSENATFTKQKASGEGTATFVALGVPELTNSLTLYYEQNGYSARFSHSFTKGSQVSGPNQNGIALASIFVDDYKQLDFSSSLDLAKVLDHDGYPTVALEVANLTKSKQRNYLQFNNATFTQYSPGMTVSLGLRGKF